jgi:hypothetical protein
MMRHRWLMCALIGATIMGCAKHQGNISVVNISDAPIKGNFGKHDFRITPQKAWTVIDIDQGENEITIGDAAMAVTVTENLTTIVEPTGTGCFVVADYRGQYGTDPATNVAIVERFKQKKHFTPKNALLVHYGRKLPKKIPEGTHARRLHTVDCSILKDKKAISKTLARLP